MRIKLATAALPVVLALTLGGCGFQPMYAPNAFTNTDGGAVIGAVNVAEIPGKAGHVLKTELERMFAIEPSDGAPARALAITLQESVAQLGIRRDESASRAELTLTASYQLTDYDGPGLTGRQTAKVTYAVPDSAFGEIAAQDDARERAAEMLAQRVRADIAMRLSQQRLANNQTP